MGRPSNKSKILILSEEHPRWSKERIALEIGCSLRTIQRHLPKTRTGDIDNNDNIDDNINDKKIITKSNQKHSSQPPQVIDDPDELLMSVAIRELNRANPDPRWASILISCKKENISNKSEVLDQFNQLPTQALVNLLSKSLQEEH